MHCPYCDSDDTKVLDKRSSGEAIRRRRECNNCGKRFTTFERIEQSQILVLKKDGRKKPFDRTRILHGISKASEKRDITPEQLNDVVDKVERSVLKLESPEVASKKIGQFVMRELKKLDKVTYVRYASVYKEFKDVEEFVALLEKV